MKRILNWYVLWFVIYVLLMNLLVYQMHALRPYMCVDLISIMVMATVGAVLLSNGLGMVLGGLILFDCLHNCWMYYFDHSNWSSAHSHGIGVQGFSYERIFDGEVIGMLVGFFVISQIVLSAMRCKEKGVSIWMALVPLYNPLALLLNKNNAKR